MVIGMIKINKLISSILVFSIMLSCIVIPASATETDDKVFEMTSSFSKDEYESGEDIEVSYRLKNVSSDILGGLVTYINYNGNVCFGPGVTEIDNDSLMTGSSINGSLILSDPIAGKNDILIPGLRAIMKFYMFISRSVVVLRRTFRSDNIFSLRRTVELERKKLTYNGKEVEVIICVSYTVIGKAVSGEKYVSFEPISAEEMNVSADEKRLCRNWFETNIINAGSNGVTPAYSFTIGKDRFADNLSEWSFSVTKKDIPYEKYRNGKYSEISFASEKYGISGRVEAVIYEDNATCEWTVFLSDYADKKSAKISDFKAVDCSLETGNSTLYSSFGSSGCADDFMLMKIAPGKNVFGCRKGRSSDYYMPYFNISGDKFGVCLGVGWSGQWETVIDNSGKTVSLSARQEKLNAALLPGEEIRSPLVSLTFYGSRNPVKGFNMFRNWIKDCFLDDTIPDTITNVDPLYVSPTRSQEIMIEDLKRIPEERFASLDNIWMDAGWYCEGTGSIWDDRFGVWQSTENRFPSGIKGMSDYAADKDMGLILWYEEERLSNVEESVLYSEAKKHKDWLLGNDSKKYTASLVWNFGNNDALDFLCRFMVSSLRENGVTVFREDSNFDPLEYWEYGDRKINGGRTGITENHYVSGHYRFIDYLFENYNELELYDVCASGGRRLDLEVIRRGVPLWRSDYNCDQHPDLVEANQSMTYSASFWLPYTGTSCYTGSEYRVRSSIYQGFQLGIDQVIDTPSYEMWMKYLPERKMVNDNFYPISFGGTDKGRITAMQYGTEDKGFAVIYKRSEVTGQDFGFRLSGLLTDGIYTVFDYDNPGEKTEHTGSELMNEGLSVQFTPGDQAIIIEYSLPSSDGD